jgi:N-sulfoglucosamine sulfohydrolase
VPMIIRWPGQVKAGTVSERLLSTIDLGPTIMSICGIPIPQHVQGRAFLGAEDTPDREYVFATRDRYDEAYDMIRAARDKRFKYLRHYNPELPYLLWVPYRNRHPIVQEWWRLHAAGDLKEPEKVMFRPRPAEELYDTQTDPFEMNNLADDPAFKADLQRMRDALDAWIDDVGDMGAIPESEMVRQWYPDGKQPLTSPALPIPICEQSPGSDAAPEGGEYTGPVLIQLHSATQGASLSYAFGEGDWQLYTAPFALPVGITRLRTKAIRIGYTESREISVDFKVT